MKFSDRKSERYSFSYRRVGRKKGYKAEVTYNHLSNNFYFMLYKGDYIFNSLWKIAPFGDEDSCVKACEEYIDSIN